MECSVSGYNPGFTFISLHFREIIGYWLYLPINIYHCSLIGNISIIHYPRDKCSIPSYYSNPSPFHFNGDTQKGGKKGTEVV